MTSVVAKYISKRVLGETMQNNFGKEVIQRDPRSSATKLTISLGPILRDRPCDPIRWPTIKQKGKEEAQGLARWHLRTRCQSPDQG